MGLISELKGTHRRDFATVVGLFLGTVGPGVLTIFLFQRSLFQQLDSIPLLALAFAIGLPVLLVNYLVVAIARFIAIEPTEPPDDDEAWAVFAMTTLLSCLVWYLALLWAFEYRRSFRDWLNALAVVQAIVALGAWAISYGYRRDRRERRSE